MSQAADSEGEIFPLQLVNPGQRKDVARAVDLHR